MEQQFMSDRMAIGEAIITPTGNITSAILYTKDIAEANMLRRAILSEIDTYAIDIVIFHVNTSPREDEVIALRLGQLMIAQGADSTFKEKEGFKVRIDFKGPGYFTTDHIPEIPFAYHTQIAKLRKGQRIFCDVIVRSGQGKQHVKWRPVSTVTIDDANDGFKITIKDNGMLPGNEIFEKAFVKMREASDRAPITIFSLPLRPNIF
jgi:DNA-directed RNA polymerase alpha subunit